MPNLAWSNGRFVPPAELTLSFADAGFVSATTVTDYCRTYHQRLFRWPDHLARFRRDCDAIGIPLPYSDTELTNAAGQLVAGRAATTGEEVSLITFASPGPIGYLLGDDANGPPTVAMHTLPLPRVRYRRYFAVGVTLRVVGVLPSDPGGIVPFGVKHRSRLHWHLAARAAREFPGAVAVLTDQHGHAADTAVGTVLTVADGVVIRPPRGAVLDGISAGLVSELCGKVGVPYAEATLDYRALPPGVTEMMLTGSAFGLAGVRSFDGRDYDWPGPVFRRLLAAWNDLVGLDIARQFLD
jgi:branched-chain amino acid aminotransferase